MNDKESDIAKTKELIGYLYAKGRNSAFPTLQQSLNWVDQWVQVKGCINMPLLLVTPHAILFASWRDMYWVCLDNTEVYRIKDMRLLYGAE